MSGLRGIVRMYAIFAALSPVMTASAVAQFEKPTGPYKPSRLEEYVAYTALWRTDAGFHTTIKIVNQLAYSEIDATPTLYMADGTAWDLPPVHLGKSAVEVVDVNAILAQAPANIRSHISTYGSASLRYHYDWQGAVYATVSILTLARSLEYNYPFIFPPGQGIGQTSLPASIRAFRDAANGTLYEGLRFRNGHNAGGFLALTNTARLRLDVHVNVKGMRTPVEKDISLLPHNTELLNLQDFFGSDEARTGTITVTQSGRKGDLQLAGGLEDLTTGYSTNLPFSIPQTHSGPTAVQKYASPGMMVNEQEQMLNFPAGLQFSPYAFFLNLSAAPRVLHSQVYYMEGKTVKTQAIPDMSLAAGEAKELKIHDLMKPLPEITDMTLVSSYSGYQGEILSATGSTDTSGNYVFPVIAEPIAPSGNKKYVFWQFSGGFDSMYSIWNPLPAPQRLLATISYGDKGETFKLPVNLEPYASTMLDIGELERSQLTDRDGRALPLSAHFGSFELGDASEAPNAMMTVVTGSGIYNPTKGTCGYGTEVCCGASSFEEYPNYITASDGSVQQIDVSYVGCNGGTYNVVGSTTMSSSNTSVATVQSMGQPQPGMMTAVAPGTGYIYANYYSPTAIPVQVTITSQLPLPACPTTNGFSAAAPAVVGSVTVTNADINGNSFSFYPTGPASLSGPITYSVEELSGPTYSQQYKSGQAVTASTCTSANPCSFGLTRPSIASTYAGSNSGFYSVAYANWSVNGSYITSAPYHFNRPWLVFGTVQDTQYNTPKESYCPAAASTAYIYSSSCAWQTVSLSTQFVSQVQLNGTGTSNSHGILKYDMGGCSGNAPAGAVRGAHGNVLASVSSVTGQCGTTLVPGGSVAVYPGPKDQYTPLNCMDEVVMVAPSTNTNSYVKSIADRCPLCNDGHVDNYAGALSCRGGSVGSVPGSPFWNVDDR